MLVDDAASERSVQIDLLAASHHRVGERKRLAAGEAAEEHRHQECRELVVGNVVEDELVELVGGELAAVALLLDELRDAAHFVATKIVM